MEETNDNANGMAQEADGENVEVNQPLEQDDRVAYSTYTKAMSQRARFKEEAERFKEENEQFKQQLLEAEGKKDEQISYWKTKARELEEKTKHREQQLFWDRIESQVKSELAVNGCVNPDKTMRLVDRKELEAMEVDDNYRISKTDLSRLVDKMKQEHADIQLFRQPVGVKDASPSSHNFDQMKEKPVNRLSREELDKAWNSL